MSTDAPSLPDDPAALRAILLRERERFASEREQHQQTLAHYEQTAIAEQIVQQGADYCLAVKGNQPTLLAGIEGHFGLLPEAGYENIKARHTATHETGHGRIEDRYYTICPVPESVNTGQKT